MHLSKGKCIFKNSNTFKYNKNNKETLIYENVEFNIKTYRYV